MTKALEDYRDDLVVIVAGYTEPMKLFFDSNPGLKSRFNTFIEFDDYSSEVLLMIVEMVANKNDYNLYEKLKKKIKDYFDEKLKDKAENFSNGRLSRNIYDNLVMAHAKRMISIDNPSKEELSLLLPDDFSDSW